MLHDILGCVFHFVINEKAVRSHVTYSAMDLVLQPLLKYLGQPRKQEPQELIRRLPVTIYWYTLFSLYTP